MTNSEPRSAAVTASGVIAILGSVFTIVGILFGLVGIFIAATVPNAPPMVHAVRLTATLMMLAFLAVAIFGIASGVGLIRFRNWARISTLVWSGIAAPICLVAVIRVYSCSFRCLETPNSPDSQFGTALDRPSGHDRLLQEPRSPSPLGGSSFSRVHASSPSFAPPLLRARTQVTRRRARRPIHRDLKPSIPSGFPTIAPSANAASRHHSQPNLPLPITVLSCFFLIGAASIFLIFFIHIPTMVFGRAFTGLTGSVIYAIWCLLYAISGIGMLRRVSWTYSLAIGTQILSIISGIMTVLSPNFDSLMRRVMTNMNMPTPDVYQVPRSNRSPARNLRPRPDLPPRDPRSARLLPTTFPRRACAAKSAKSSTQQSSNPAFDDVGKFSDADPRPRALNRPLRNSCSLSRIKLHESFCHRTVTCRSPLASFAVLTVTARRTLSPPRSGRYGILLQSASGGRLFCVN